MRLDTLIILCLVTMVLCLSRASAEKPADGLATVMVLKIEGGDGKVKISWRLKDGPILHGDVIKGIRVYRMKDGPETGYNIPLYTLIDDEKSTNSSFVIGKLKNGEQYVFQLRAYNKQNEEFLDATLRAFPGSDPAGIPSKPAGFYAVAGNNRVALYWERNTEADLVGYEIYRKSFGEAEFSLLSRVPKIVRIESKEFFNQNIQAVNPGMYVDTAVENGKDYQYRIRSIDAEGYFSEFTRSVTVKPTSYAPPSGENILLLVNAEEGDSNGNGINDSEEVALHYAKLRGVPERNILRIYVWGKLRSHTDTIEDYESHIQKPIREYLFNNNLLNTVRYIVPCYGMPVRFAGRALDSKLADLFDRYTYGRQMGTPHPYYESSRHFDGTYGIYLVTRIDGPTVEIAKGLVDKAIAAEKRVTARSGTAYFAANGSWEGRYNELIQARKLAAERQIKTVYRKGEFGENELPDDALWYFTLRHLYKNPKNGKWRPGAVGFHLTSNSFYKIRKGTWDPKMKSWVEGLLEHGITATLGAVIEPYLQGYTKPDVFFKALWSGEYNFAESFMMATPSVQWAMSAVGDPLYQLARPYSENK